MEQAVAEQLTMRGETLSTAESCTGGLVAARFTAMPGASKYFLGSVVAYSNDVKITTLGVSSADLEQHGAVSRQVAEQMAEGVRRITGSTYGIATTGIAGPDGGTPQKPVGTVWLAAAMPTGILVEKRQFGPLREQNIRQASDAAIDLLHRVLNNNGPVVDL